jgi:hypothetical protein
MSDRICEERIGEPVEFSELLRLAVRGRGQRQPASPRLDERVTRERAHACRIGHEPVVHRGLEAAGMRKATRGEPRISQLPEQVAHQPSRDSLERR